MSTIRITFRQHKKYNRRKIALFTFSCVNFFINLISLKIRLASTGSSNALVIFLMATFSLDVLSNAELNEHIKEDTKLCSVHLHYNTISTMPYGSNERIFGFDL